MDLSGFLFASIAFALIGVIIRIGNYIKYRHRDDDELPAMAFYSDLIAHVSLLIAAAIFGFWIFLSLVDSIGAGR